MKSTVGGVRGYVLGNSKASLKLRPAYGVPSGPSIVAVHFMRFSSLGKADMPGVEDIMSVISSVCKLEAILD